MYKPRYFATALVAVPVTLAMGLVIAALVRMDVSLVIYAWCYTGLAYILTRALSGEEK